MCLCPVDIKAYEIVPIVGIDSFVCLCLVDVEAYVIVPIGLALISYDYELYLDRYESESSLWSREFTTG